MTSHDSVKLYKSGSNYSINFHKEFIKDSAFPFEIKDMLTAKIDGTRLILEKTKTGVK